MNKIIILFIIVIVFANIYAYTAPELINSEYFVDNMSNEFNIYSIANFINSNNYVLISGGCYNVELLSINSLIKFHINILNTNWFFDYINYNFANMEQQNTLTGYGLSYKINDYFNIGFIANPTFEKRESDFSVVIRFNGFDTKNEFILIAENFDNNYSNKNQKYENPILYTYPKILPGAFMVFPFNYILNSYGKIKNFEFIGNIYNKLPRSIDHYDSEYNYLYSSDSIGLYSKMAGINTYNWNNLNIKNVLTIDTRYLKNTKYILSDSIYEFDKYYRIETYIDIVYKSHLGFLIKYAYINRNIKDYDNNVIYELNGNEVYAALSYTKNNFKIELGEIINPYNVIDTLNAYNDMQTRLLLQLTYKFNNNTLITVKKGFETDIKDIENGGKFFFYDKMYVHFEGNFDIFLKE